LRGALGRIGRIDRQISGADAQDTDHGDDEVDAATHPQGDHATGTGAGFTEGVDDGVGASQHLAVGEAAVRIADSRGVRGGGSGRCDEGVDGAGDRQPDRRPGIEPPSRCPGSPMLSADSGMAGSAATDARSAGIVAASASVPRGPPSTPLCRNVMVIVAPSSSPSQ
jgi:hypothetical protein